jgi:acetylornithine/succinyldiaminopimelate/putrescine aminotransferase
MAVGEKRGGGEATMTRQSKERIFALFGRYINRNQIKYLSAGHLDVFETQREGVGFTDPVTGRRMYDCFTAAGCFNVSRHNPEVMAALAEAADELDMGSYLLSSPQKEALTRRLAALAPGDLNHVMFAAGGGEAVECALKMARGATGRKQIISTVKAYHGHTGFALSANGKEHYRHCFEPLMPEFIFVPFNDLDAMTKAVSEQTAAVILEPVQGEAGIFPGTPAYLRGLRELCDRHGALLIFDEIQTGFGRTGRMFASEHSGVVPDMMTLAKSLGGGLYANAAMLYRDIPVLRDFAAEHPDFHETHCGGSDIACRVSLKVLDCLEEHKLCENAARQGAKLKEALAELMRANPKIIKEVRGIGLMVGLEYVEEFLGPMMSDALAKHGVFAAYSGNAPQVMRFMMPITVSDAELDDIIAAIQGAVKDMKTLLPLALLAAKIPGVLKLLNNEKIQTNLFTYVRKIEDLWHRGAGR